MKISCNRSFFFCVWLVVINLTFFSYQKCTEKSDVSFATSGKLVPIRQEDTKITLKKES